MAQSLPENLNKLSELTTADLQELLEAELESDAEPDVDRLRAIVEVLDKRRMAQSADVDAAWSSFVDDHLPVEPLFEKSSDLFHIYPQSQSNIKKQIHHRRRFTRVAIAAALVATFLLGATLSAVAAGSRLKNTTVLWSRDTFSFAYGHTEKEQMEQNTELAPLRETMDGSGMRENVVPNFLPQGYTQTLLESDGGKYTAEYSDGANTVRIIYEKIRSGGTEEYPRDEGVPEVYSVGGIEHYISTWEGKYFAAWTNDGYGCLITGVADKDDLIQMIDSVYVELRG